MTIKELEERTGLERTTIRFYEKEGFITPTRLENGYRDFSEDDLNLLLRIKLLRSLLIPVDEIRGLQNGSLHLNATLSKQMERLEEEIGNLTYAKDLCKMLQKEQVTFETLDATKYLDKLPEVEPTILSSFQASDYKVSDKQLFEEMYPFRRFFARMIDFFVYDTLVSVVLALIFQVRLASTSFIVECILFVLPLVCMLYVEPWLLCRFHTTLGKWIFGLSVIHADDTPLTYKEGLERTKKILFWGLGLKIPFIQLVTLGFSFSRCINQTEQPWSTFDVKLVAKKVNKFRYLLVIPVTIVCMFIYGLLVTVQLLPPNRGDLTQEELIENMEYYMDFMKQNFINRRLDENGQWIPNENDIAPSQLPDSTYTYRIEDGIVTSVSFEINATRIEGNIYPDYSEAKLTAFAFGCAQGNIIEAIKLYLTLDKTLSQDTFDTVYLKTDTIQMRCYTQTQEYYLGAIQYIGETSPSKYYLMLNEDTTNDTEPFYRFRFSIRKPLD